MLRRPLLCLPLFSPSFFSKIWDACRALRSRQGRVHAALCPSLQLPDLRASEKGEEWGRKRGERVPVTEIHSRHVHSHSQKQPYSQNRKDATTSENLLTSRPSPLHACMYASLLSPCSFPPIPEKKALPQLVRSHSAQSPSEGAPGAAPAHRPPWATARRTCQPRGRGPPSCGSFSSSWPLLLSATRMLSCELEWPPATRMKSVSHWAYNSEWAHRCSRTRPSSRSVSSPGFSGGGKSGPGLLVCRRGGHQGPATWSTENPQSKSEKIT